jgi:restriction system protein
LSWQHFETLVAEAYRRQGYTVQKSPGAGPDEGVDLTLRKDGCVTVVQCKQWRAWKVEVKVVREIYGLMTDKRAEAAIVITSGAFTKEAKAFAHRKPIELVDGPQLATLIRGVQKAAAGAEQHPTSPSLQSSARLIPNVICPKCGASMVLRTAQRGSHAGQQFWGCSRFPACRMTAPLEKESEVGETTH